MPFGLLHQMWAMAPTSDRNCIEDAIEDAALADELAYDSFWFGEHHHHRHKAFFGRLPHPELLIARVCGETRQIKLGTGVKVLPFDTPCRFAESITLLDILTEGRITFGVGMSMRTHKLAARHERGEEFRTQLSHLMRYLDKDHRDDLEPITPEPLRDYRSVLWVAAREPETVAHAASLGLNFVVGQLEQAAKQREFVDVYRGAGGIGEVRGVRMVHVAETDDEAWRFVEQAARRMHEARATTAYGRLAVAEGRMSTTGTDDRSEMLRQVEFIAGSPDTVTSALLDYMDTAAVDRVDLMMHVPGVPRDAIRRSLHLFSTEVAPAMRRDRAQCVLDA
jgi:alkanesulfonate monooxygenase SsuD/methylene tetrahydromethanopterin reductase-like flavin-dependent oxidoreductase (luciferase family)